MPELSEPSTSPSLLAAACRGQNDAWNRLVQLYGPLVYRWVRRTGLQASSAADVTQDVLMSVSKDLANFDPAHPGAKFRGWLWVITRRRIADAARQRPHELALGSALNQLAIPHSADGEAIADWEQSGDPPTDASTDSKTILRRAVAVYRDRYDPHTWQAFWATVVEDRSPEEVASTLGISRWTVYKARARILQRLREELSGLVDFE